MAQPLVKLRVLAEGAIGAATGPEAPEVPEAVLMQRVGNGDREAARLLIDRHLGRITAFSNRMLGDAAEAEDVAQETFLRLWRHAGRWEPRALIGTWLHRVVVNLCIDRERRAKLRRWLSLEAAPDVATDEIASDARFAARQELHEVLGDIRGLPPRQRAAILLAADGERSNAEIGRSLGVSEKAVEALLVRARRTLRARLQERQGGMK